MKQFLHRGNDVYKAEWLQALFTLMVLVTLYSYSLTFNSEAQGPPGEVPKKQTSSYWNEEIGYWFRWGDDDIYEKQAWKAPDTVSVSAWKTSILSGKSVQVSFYTDTPIETIEKTHSDMAARAYSRLSNGIAVIEGDLSSSRAKNILATLHAR